MWSDKTWYGLITAVYGCLTLTYLWPYLSQVWYAFREKKSIREVARPAANRLLAAGLTFLAGVLWIWVSFRQ